MGDAEYSAGRLYVNGRMPGDEVALRRLEELCRKTPGVRLDTDPTARQGAGE